MRIKSIQIDSFGKLKNYRLGLEDGFNIVCGDNEDGKSTVMAFLKMMFYGSSGRGSDLAKNPRKKYLPWSGEKMAGSVAFEYDGIEYILTRQFGSSNATDKVTLLNTATARQEQVSGSPGQRFFSLGEATFEKSVFIGQAGSFGDTAEGSNDELTQKLLNLVSAGDETVSPELVAGRLEKAKADMLASSGRNRRGVIDNLAERLSRLNERKSAALREEDEKKEMERAIAALAREEAAYEAEAQALSATIGRQTSLESLRALESWLRSRRELEEQEKEAQRDGVAFDEAFVQQGEGMLAELGALKERCLARRQAVKDCEEQLAGLNGRALPAIEPETVGRVQDMERMRRNALGELDKLARQKACAECAAELAGQERLCGELEEAASKAKDALTEAEGALAAQQKAREKTQETLGARQAARNEADTAYRLALQKQENVRTQADRDLGAAQELLRQAQAARPAEESPGNGKRAVWIIAAAIVLAASAVLGALVHPACYAGAAAALALLLIGLNRKPKAAGLRFVVDEEAVTKARAAREETERGAARAAEDAARGTEETRLALAAADAGLGALRDELTERERRLRTLGERLTEAQKQKNELEQRFGVANGRRASLAQELTKRRNEGGETQEDAERLSARIAEQTQAAAELARRIGEALSAAGCADIDELIQKNTLSVKHRALLDAAEAALVQAQKQLKEADAAYKDRARALIAFVSRFRPAGDIRSAGETLQGLKSALAAAAGLRARIDGQRDLLNKEMRGITPEQGEERAEKLREAFAAEGGLPAPLEAQELSRLRARILENQRSVKDTHDRLTMLSSDIRNKFAGRPTVSDIEEEIRAAEAEIAEKRAYYESLVIARETLAEAAQDLRQVFSPRLNTLTAGIFSRLTGGKYEKVYVSPAFSILAQEANTSLQREWGFLSSGTVDQAYLALRLAIAGELTEGGPALPLFLDDVLLQYDDVRMEQGLRFLSEEASRRSGQIVLFTCRRAIADWGRNADGPHVKAIV